METPNKIKFIDDDGSVEVLEPPMTARVHVETPNQEENTGPEVPDTIQETIEEESSSDEDIVVVSSSIIAIAVGSEPLRGEKDCNTNINDIEDLSPSTLNPEGVITVESITEEVIEKVVFQSLGLVEQHVKDLEKMESVIASSVEAIQGSPDVIKIDEVKVPVLLCKTEQPSVAIEKEEVDKEALSIVVNAVQDVRAEEHKQITPKGCCILQ